LSHICERILFFIFIGVFLNPVIVLSRLLCCSLGNEPFLKQGIVVFAEAEKEEKYIIMINFREHRFICVPCNTKHEIIA